MNVYKLLKSNRLIRSSRLKLAGILALHQLRRRYFGLFLDPVLGCNMRCQMCYFSDDDYRRQARGRFSPEQIRLVADKFFPYALKLQVGCGAEPTLYGDLSDIFALAKQRGVPYISMTTNANLLQKDDLRRYSLAGLDELTLSLHGVRQATYETLMEGGSYDKLLSAMAATTELKKEFKSFKLRVNYTINEDNCLELADFFDVFGHYGIDILQMRPIQKLGNSKYANFSHKSLIANYDATIGKVKAECRRRGITVVCPDKADLTKQRNDESIVFDYTYIYMSPREFFDAGFSLESDTYHAYRKRQGFPRQLLKRIFSRSLSSDNRTKLNYGIN